MNCCTTRGCTGFTGLLWKTSGQWIEYCPVCKSQQAAEAPRTPDGADQAAAHALRQMQDAHYAKAEAGFLSAAANTGEKARKAYYLWLSLLCRYGVSYVEDVLFENLPGKRTSMFLPTFGRFPLPDTDIRQTPACRELTGLAAEYAAPSVDKQLTELDILLKEIHVCLKKASNKSDVFIAWHDDADDEENTCRNLADKLNRHLALSKECYSFVSFQDLQHHTVDHYEPHIYAALAAASVMVIIIRNYDALGRKFLALELNRFLNRKRSESNLRVYFCGMRNHTGSIPVALQKDGLECHRDNCEDANIWAEVIAKDVLNILREQRRKERAAVSVTPPPVTPPAADPISEDLIWVRFQLNCKNWANAKERLNELNKQYPSRGEIYLYMLLAEYQLSEEKQLITLELPYEETPYWQFANRTADEALRSRMDTLLADTKKERERRAQEAAAAKAAAKKASAEEAERLRREQEAAAKAAAEKAAAEEAERLRREQEAEAANPRHSADDMLYGLVQESIASNEAAKAAAEEAERQRKERDAAFTRAAVEQSERQRREREAKEAERRKAAAEEAERQRREQQAAAEAAERRRRERETAAEAAHRLRKEREAEEAAAKAAEDARRAADEKLYNVITGTAPEASAVVKQLQDLNIKASANAGGVSISNGRSFSGATLAIPGGVIRIDDLAFWNSNIKAAHLPETVTAIGSWAFDGCSNLLTINIPASVTSIGGEAFRGCPNLIVTVASGSYGEEYCRKYRLRHTTNTAAIQEHIGDLNKINRAEIIANARAKLEAMDVRWATVANGLRITDGKYCRRDNAVIPEGVTIINHKAFDNSWIASLQLPASLRNIEERAFSFCRGLTDAALQEGVASIGKHAFWCCTKLRSVNIPKSVSRIGSGAFAGCTSLGSIRLAAGQPDFCTMDGVLMTRDCTRILCMPAASTITDYKAPAGVRVIDDAFEGCTSLRTVSLPDGVEQIGGYAFRGCTGLSSVNIPQSVTSISDGAFKHCPNLTLTVTPGSYGERYCRKYGLSHTVAEASASQKTPSGTPGAAASEYSHTADVLRGMGIECRITPRGIHITNGTGYQAKRLTIPEGVIVISRNAFELCSNLTELVLPEGLIRVEEGAFLHCTGLVSVTLPRSLLTIEDYAFGGCDQLRTFLLPANHPRFTLKDNVLYDRKGHRIICMPAGSGHTSIRIGADVNNINGAFYGCKSLRTVRFEANGVITSGRNADSTPNLDYFGHNAFTCCEKLRDVILPEGVSIIGREAFMGCKSLAALRLPRSVEEIQNHAFANCPNLVLTIAPGSGAEAYCRNNGLRFVYDRTASPAAHPAAATRPAAETRPAAARSANSKPAAAPEKSLPAKPTPKQIETAYYQLNAKGITTQQHPFGLALVKGTGYTGKHLEIPEGVTTIGDMAFWKFFNMKTLESVSLPDTLTCIGSDAFGYCTSLTSVVIPDGVTHIGKAAFAGCAKLKQITLPAGLKTLSANMFKWCNQLTEVTVPEGVNTIEAGAFESCASLRTVRIPASVKTIGQGNAEKVFVNTKNVTVITPRGSAAEIYCRTHNIPYRNK